MKQNGFTLIETIIAIGLGTIITLGAVLTIFQITHNTSRSNSHTIAIEEMSHIVVQIKRDLQSYETANFSDLRNGPTSLAWTNLSGFEPFDERDHYVIYSLSGNTLYREADNITGIIGRHVESLSFSGDTTYAEIQITVTSDNYPPKSESFEFMMHHRTTSTDE